MLVALYKISEVYFRLLGTYGIHAKAKKERFSAAGFRCRQNLKYENFTSSFGRLRQNIAPKSVRLFFLIQPIKSMICGVVADAFFVSGLNFSIKNYKNWQKAPDLRSFI